MGRKTYTVGGDAAYRITIYSIYTLFDFARALSEHSLDDQIDFEILTKSQAAKILKERFEKHGREGEWINHDDIGDATDRLNEQFDLSRKWVEKNYPYLSTKKGNLILSPY